MRVLITGGAGYIGSELVHQLAYDDAIEEILIYDNLSRKNYNLFLFDELPTDKIRFIQGELLNSRKLRQVLEGVDVVYHLAAKVSTPFANDDSHSFEQINHWGTAELSYALEESDVDTLIYTSSCSIYGADHDKPVTRDTPPNPGTFYGISKLQGENMLERLQSKMNVYIMRCGNVYGYSTSMRFDAVINRFMFEAQYKNKITIKGSGYQYRPFIHVDKVVYVLQQLLHQDIPPDTYNLVEKNLSILDLRDTLIDLYPKLETLFINQDLQMRSLQAETDNALASYELFAPTDLKEDLKAFKEQFAFAPATAQ